MIGPLIGIVGIACILGFAEVLRASRIVIHGEILRKFVHIATGTFAATWIFFMPVKSIQILSVLLFIVVVVSKRMSIFRSVHEVSRLTYGEELFPAGIFFSATLAGSEWVYVAAVLHLGLADGLAAMVGMLRAKRFRYKVFGQTKSLLGSATFYVLSLAITSGAIMMGAGEVHGASVLVLAWLPLVATLVESVAVFGTDNVLVPLVVIAALNSINML